jgi:hypothetical protein
MSRRLQAFGVEETDLGNMLDRGSHRELPVFK